MDAFTDDRGRIVVLNLVQTIRENAAYLSELDARLQMAITALT